MDAYVLERTFMARMTGMSASTQRESLEEYVDLTAFNTLALPSQARYFYRLNHLSQLTTLTTLQQKIQLPIWVLGGGSNVVLANELNAIVVHNQLKGNECLHEDAHTVVVRVGAGENWDQWVRWTIENAYAGIENLIAIPGTVGAAPIQNIGAYGVEVKEAIQQVEFFDFATQKTQYLSARECGFGYRESIFKQGLAGRGIITSVDFQLNKNPQQINTRYGALAEQSFTTIGEVAQFIALTRHRKLPNPAQLANVGSFFKNPNVSREAYSRLKAQFPNLVAYPEGAGYKLSAAWLIEAGGFKAYREGSVGVYAHHALILVNYGGARAHEILQLAQKIQLKIEGMFGVSLVREPVLLGKD